MTRTKQLVLVPGALFWFVIHIPFFLCGRHHVCSGLTSYDDATNNNLYDDPHHNHHQQIPTTSQTRHTKTNRRTLVIMDDLVDVLEQMDPKDAAKQVMERIGSNMEHRLVKLFEKATSQQCRATIAEHFGYFVNAIGTERSLPFADITFTNECPSPPRYDYDNPPPPSVHLGIIQNKTYQPIEGIYKKPDEITFCYAIMTHQHPEETIRLIESLYEPGHVFIIHVDAKQISQSTHDILQQYASNNRPYIHVLDHPYRVRVNWGGFSMVNATLQMLRYSFQHNLQYDKFIHLASSNYPIASNAKIRHSMAQYPIDANLLYVVLKPSRPKQASWHYFVECDDAVHRIYRLPPLLNATANVELYTSSQWFTLSREFAYYLAFPPPQSFVQEFMEYAQHVVVADETFFGTVLLHSPYCDKHHNWNGVHLQFDQWENQVALEHRDSKKCIMPDPNHCGRSPTTITMDYVDLLTLSDDLFARKFVHEKHHDHVVGVKDVLDQHRQEQQLLYKDYNNKQRQTNSSSQENTTTSSSSSSGIDVISMPNKVNTTFEGHGVLLVAKATVSSKTPLCMGLGPSGNYAKLVPCFFDIVIPSLATGWETGAVIVEETPLHNRWNLGPCTPDGNLERL
jgi:Core-2/I-Branching enzyme